MSTRARRIPWCLRHGSEIPLLRLSYRSLRPPARFPPRAGYGLVAMEMSLLTGGTDVYIGIPRGGRRSAPQSYLIRLSLHEEILDFCQWISPWSDEHRMREWVIDKVSMIIRELWPKADVRIYGSFSTQLYLPSRYAAGISVDGPLHTHAN